VVILLELCTQAGAPSFMFSSLPQEIQTELYQLAQRYGQPIVHKADLQTTRLFNPLNKVDRYGEVCMVIQRKNGRLLLSKKIFYPSEAYRLPTGGINIGESVYHALLRETYEETGLEFEVQRFLAAVAYRLPRVQEEPVFYTFAFLIDETGGILKVIDTKEQVEGFREIEPEQLPAIADHLEHPIPSYSTAIGGNWEDWGRFRAVIHRLVWQALLKGAD
jgi:ADP-ribose pyrophosphatase YjhB (NUDIX family)